MQLCTYCFLKLLLKSIKKRKMHLDCLFLLCNYLYPCYFPICVDLNYYLRSLLSAWRTSFNVSCKSGLPATSLWLCGKTYILSSFFKNTALLDIGFYTDSCFLWALGICYSTATSIVSDGKSAVNLIGVLL